MDISYVLESLLVFNPIEALSILLAVYMIYNKKIDWKIINHSYGLGTLFLLIQIPPVIFESIPILYAIASLLSFVFAFVILYLYFNIMLNIKIKLHTILIIIVSICIGTIIVISVFNMLDMNMYDFINGNFWTSLFIILIIKILTFLSIIIINKIFLKGLKTYEKFTN